MRRNLKNFALVMAFLLAQSVLLTLLAFFDLLGAITEKALRCLWSAADWCRLMSLRSSNAAERHALSLNLFRRA